MSKSNDDARYIDRFLSFSSWIEVWLIRIAVVIAACIFIIQSLLQYPDVRHAIVKVEQLEGKPYEAHKIIDYNRGFY